MNWLKKPSQPQKQAIIEIEANKNAHHEAVVKAKAASEDLNSLLVENGFTLKIYLATGGHIKQTQKGK